MAPSIPNQAQRYAVVTGANKGIGFEICRQLAAASEGITVIFTARDKDRGFQAVERLRNESGLTENNLVFHQLDVLDSASIDALVKFIQINYGKLDILVNNAGISGVGLQGDPRVLEQEIEKDIATVFSLDQENGAEVKKAINGKILQTFEDAEKCIDTNLYGAKRVAEAFIPLLQLSDLPRIVNVSSTLGSLKLLCNEWGKQVLSNEEGLTEEKVDLVVEEFLKNFRGGSKEANGWPCHFAAYKVSKAALNAYTRIMAKKHPEMCINCVCPGFTRTDITCNQGPLSAAEAAENVVALALLPDEGGPSGLYFCGKQEMAF